jgi:hypothetical protein
MQFGWILDLLSSLLSSFEIHSWTDSIDVDIQLHEREQSVSNSKSTLSFATIKTTLQFGHRRALAFDSQKPCKGLAGKPSTWTHKMSLKKASVLQALVRWCSVDGANGLT